EIPAALEAHREALVQSPPADAIHTVPHLLALADLLVAQTGIPMPDWLPEIGLPLELASGRPEVSGVAAALCQQALREAEAHAQHCHEADAHAALARILRQSGDFEGALNHFEAETALRQRMFNDRADLRVKSLHIQF